MSEPKQVLAAVLGSMSVTTWPAVVLLLIAMYRILSIGHRDKRLPPGPPTVPILGNIHQIPITGMYKKYVSIAMFRVDVRLNRRQV